jgi:regulator of replication initiation timing
MFEFPDYISKQGFNQTELTEAIKLGAFDNQRDSYNNLVIKSDEVTQDSKVGDYLIAIPTEKRKQIPQQVETFYDTTIGEFSDIESDELDEVTTTELTTIVDEVEESIEEQQLLQSQIDELSEKLDEEIDKAVRFKEDASQTFAASRDLIVSQRIKSGEGDSPNDFSDTFPFLPLTEAEKLNDDLPREQFPFMGT